MFSQKCLGLDQVYVLLCWAGVGYRLFCSDFVGSVNIYFHLDFVFHEDIRVCLFLPFYLCHPWLK